MNLNLIPRRPVNDPALGGWKPTMLNNSMEVLVNYKTTSKFGYYERSSDRKILARRVELPEWVDHAFRSESLLAALQSRCISIPPLHSRERQGHIYWNPRPHGIRYPMIGVDEEICSAWVETSFCEQLVFVVYRFGKIELERWQISKKKFLESAIRIQPSVTFMPQLMVPVTLLVLERGV